MTLCKDGLIADATCSQVEVCFLPGGIAASAKAYRPAGKLGKDTKITHQKFVLRIAVYTRLPRFGCAPEQAKNYNSMVSQRPGTHMISFFIPAFLLNPGGIGQNLLTCCHSGQAFLRTWRSGGGRYRVPDIFFAGGRPKKPALTGNCTMSVIFVSFKVCVIAILPYFCVLHLLI